MDTTRLIYCSRAVPDLGNSDLLTLAERSAANNKLRGITGFLMLGDGIFLQVVEGTSTVLNALLHRLLTDRRHTDLRLISFMPITTRSFAHWSMRTINWEQNWPNEHRSFLCRQFGMPQFDPASLTAARTLSFLEVLAELVRRQDQRTLRGLRTV